MENDNGEKIQKEKQRETAAALARRKVMEAYGVDARNFENPGEMPKIDADEWKKYHSAWQDYYQKYYGDYYSQAAKSFVEQEKLKYEQTHVGDERVEREVAEKTAEDVRGKIRAKASDRARKVRRSKHFVPIVIGVVVILLGVAFQYNQVIFANVAAYVTPGGGSVSEISAIDSGVLATVGPESLLVIPKLNVSVPIIYGAANDVDSMNVAMGGGVAHFAIPGASAVAGEVGNFVVSGHSSNNVYSTSEYKFVFSGLDRLEAKDLIYVNYNSIRYTYSVTSKKVVEPTDVGVLVYDTDRPVLTLITCTPLGTSRYRLIVTAEQISPDPSGAIVAEPPAEGVPAETMMPTEEPSPLESFWGWMTGA